MSVFIVYAKGPSTVVVPAWYFEIALSGIGVEEFDTEVEPLWRLRNRPGCWSYFAIDWVCAGKTLNFLEACKNFLVSGVEISGALVPSSLEVLSHRLYYRRVG